MQQIATVDALEVGDVVQVSGNGIDIEREVVATDTDEWKGGSYARLAGNDVAYRLVEKNLHPLQSGDKMHLNGHGTVVVER